MMNIPTTYHTVIIIIVYYFSSSKSAIQRLQPHVRHDRPKTSAPTVFRSRRGQQKHQNQTRKSRTVGQVPFTGNGDDHHKNRKVIIVSSI